MSGKYDVDIVCVYNDVTCYENELLSSIYRQKTQYQFRVIGIDNTEGKYKSMAKAYNDVLQMIQGEWVIFCHQDIRLNREESLEEIIQEVKKIGKDCIFGSYGVEASSRKTIISNAAPIKVESVDECFFGGTTTQIKKLRFNEMLCDNWHMYAAEICMHNTMEKGCNYVIKSDVTHLSPGRVTLDYVKTLYKVAKYYKAKKQGIIWTTCAKINLERPYKLYVVVWLLKHEIINKIIRPIKKIKKT